MLEFYFYVLWIWLRDKFRPALRWNEPSEYGLVALPLLHSEGIRKMGMPGYLLFFYVGMWGQANRSGLLWLLWAKRWRWVGSQQTLKMRRPIALFSRLTVRFDICAWDHRSFIFRTIYLHRGEVCATNYTQVLIVADADGRRIDPREVLRALGADPGEQSAEWPEAVRHWRRAEVAPAPFVEAPAVAQINP